MIDNTRWTRGEAIWRRGVVRANGAAGQYYVPSEAGRGRYLVATPWAACGMRCQCADHVERGMICKHIVAASLVEAAQRVRAYLASGGDLRELKLQAIRAGLEGPSTAERAVVWRAGYEVIQMLEDRDLAVAEVER